MRALAATSTTALKSASLPSNPIFEIWFRDLKLWFRCSFDLRDKWKLFKAVSTRLIDEQRGVYGVRPDPKRPVRLRRHGAPPRLRKVDRCGDVDARTVPHLFSSKHRSGTTRSSNPAVALVEHPDENAARSIANALSASSDVANAKEAPGILSTAFARGKGESFGLKANAATISSARDFRRGADRLRGKP